MAYWTEQQMRLDLPRILKLKGVDNAVLTHDGIRFVTKKGLRHHKSLFPLPQIEVKLDYDNPWEMQLRHAHETLLRHPAMVRWNALRADRWRMLCLGEYADDFTQAHRKGPYAAVIASLAIIQTIEKDPRARFRWSSLPLLEVVVFAAIIGMAVSVLGISFS